MKPSDIKPGTVFRIKGYPARWLTVAIRDDGGGRYNITAQALDGWTYRSPTPISISWDMIEPVDEFEMFVRKTLEEHERNAAAVRD